MKNSKITPAFFISFILFLVLIVSGIVYAVKEPAAIITVLYAQGYVDVKYSDSSAFVPLTEGEKIGPGDLIQTDDEGTVELMLPDKSILKIGPLSHVLVKESGTLEVTKATTSAFELIKGTIRAVVTPLLNRESSFTIQTNNATVGVRGTDFGISYNSDTDSTYILGVSGCVIVSLIAAPGNTYDICEGKEILIKGGEKTKDPVDASKENIRKFLEEMKIRGESTKLPEEIPLPFIADIFLNRSISLRDVEGTLSLNRDNLNIDRKIVISGTAVDERNRIVSVSVSLDGGTTWEDAVGTNNWSYEFSPVPEREYDLIVRAVNDRGAQSDPHEFGPLRIVFLDSGTEDIVREFAAAFVDGLRNEDVSGIREIVSEGYDGSIGGYYSKDELVDEGIRDIVSVMGSSTISYSIDQVSAVGQRIVGVMRWTASFMGTKKSGTTKWWLSARDNYALVHSEGDWFFAGVNPDVIILPEGLFVEEIDNGQAPPCHKSVRILLTLPALAETYSSVTVYGATYCPATPPVITLTRAFYNGYTGTNRGFGAEVPVEFFNAPPCSPSCSTMVYGDSSPGWENFNCSFTSYGYVSEKTFS